MDKMNIDWLNENSTHAMGPNIFISLVYLLKKLTIALDVSNVNLAETNTEFPRINTKFEKALSSCCLSGVIGAC